LLSASFFYLPLFWALYSLLVGTAAPSQNLEVASI